MFRLTLLLLTLLLVEKSYQATWCYTGDGCTGPDDWGTVDANCDGSSQSPINIDTSDTTVDLDLGEFIFVNYDEVIVSNWTLGNNGHTVSVTMDNEANQAALAGGGLPGIYTLKQFHPHFGSVDTQGSEHTIDGMYYPLEMHLVHMSLDYDSFTEAFDNAESLAVLGVMFEIQDDDNEDLAPVFDRLTDVMYENNQTTIDPIMLGGLLPTDRSRFWRYSGSLTTPTCNEVVVWTVFEDTVKMSEAQLELFRDLFISSDDSESMVDNYRPVMDLNGRVVYYSAASMATGVTSSVLVALLVSLRNILAH